jgi:hypothetical protein
VKWARAQECLRSECLRSECLRSECLRSECLRSECLRSECLRSVSDHKPHRQRRASRREYRASRPAADRSLKRLIHRQGLRHPVRPTIRLARNRSKQTQRQQIMLICRAVGQQGPFCQAVGQQGPWRSRLRGRRRPLPQPRVRASQPHHPPRPSPTTIQLEGPAPTDGSDLIRTAPLRSSQPPRRSPSYRVGHPLPPQPPVADRRMRISRVGHRPPWRRPQVHKVQRMRTIPIPRLRRPCSLPVANCNRAKWQPPF